MLIKLTVAFFFNLLLRHRFAAGSGGGGWRQSAAGGGGWRAGATDATDETDAGTIPGRVRRGRRRGADRRGRRGSTTRRLRSDEGVSPRHAEIRRGEPVRRAERTAADGSVSERERASEARPASNATRPLARPFFPRPLPAPRPFRAFADPGENRRSPLRRGPRRAAAADEPAEKERRPARMGEEQVAALAAREAATAGELAAKDDGAGERHAEMERRLAEREEEHAAALATREEATADERTAERQDVIAR